MTIYMKTLIQKSIILASASPRRKQLLEQMGIQLTIHPAMIDENNIQWTDPGSFVMELSRQKALAISHHYSDEWIIGADTIVVLDDQILGKPESTSHALRMLTRLSGRMHAVYTGFCIYQKSSRTSITRFAKSDVFFKTLAQEEIEWYSDTHEPYDKAGAYGIQGMGAFLVEKIQGSYTNVVGLPVCELFQNLLNMGIIQIKDT